MKTTKISVELKKVVITPSGAGLFLGNEKKVFVIYVDILMGEQIRLALKGESQPRPLTFDFIRYILHGFDISIKTIVIYNAKNGVFFSKVIFLQKGTIDKYVEMDIRPSDAILLSLSASKPIFVDEDLFKNLPDASELLNNFNKLNAE